MSVTRSSGVLLHPTSLPGGRLGPEAHAFVDWLAAAGQRWWQMLPLGPPDEHRSPYKSSSAFAAWPGLLADPDAPVSGRERDRFRARSNWWLDDWERFGGDADDQVRFDREWRALRAHAQRRGVRLIGDVPIYIAAGSADHAAHPELFRDDVVAGAPPDLYTDDGQLWGNPVYDWPALRRRGYRWWIERFRRTLELFDAARVDHFRGFVSYWAVPPDAPTAASGRWRRGPGAAPFLAARRALGRLPLIAEDLGVITPPVVALRRALKIPGTVVIEFAFEGDPRSVHVPANHARDAVAYTATHDQDTLVGWWDHVAAAQRERALATLGAFEIPNGPINWRLIELVQRSRAERAIVGAQDLLGLGRAARMNVPGRERGNWRWRLEPGALDAALARHLARVTRAASRA